MTDDELNKEGLEGWEFIQKKEHKDYEDGREYVILETLFKREILPTLTKYRLFEYKTVTEKWDTLNWDKVI